MNKCLIALMMPVYVLLCPISEGASPPHAFHTSLAQINYDAKTKVLEISLRVFTDDLESALSKENSRKIKLDDTAQQDRLLEAYVKKQFALIDQKGQPKAIHFIGKEFEVDATWIYLEVPCNESIQGMNLRDAILTDMFDDQTNVVNLTYLAVKKTFLFKRESPVQLISL
jgi:hypothetical protein